MEKEKIIDLSIIVICYNFESIIGKALNSVGNQTYMCSQLIIIDDGSTDHSTESITNWVRNNDKKLEGIQIKLVYKENEGLVKTLNKAVSLVTQKYVSILSGDDEMECKRNEIMYSEIEIRNEMDALFSGYYENDILNNERRIIKIRIGEEFNSLRYRDRIRSVFFKTSFWIGSGIFKTTIFKKLLFDTKYKNLEDVPFKLNLVKDYKIAMIDIPLTTYCLFNNNMTRIRDKEITRDSIRLAFEYRKIIGFYYFLILLAMYYSNYFNGLYIKNNNILALVLSVIIYPPKIKRFIHIREKYE
jgi:glycosyltransferase involved in cell wall biosynthesis